MNRVGKEVMFGGDKVKSGCTERARLNAWEECFGRICPRLAQ